MIRIIGSFLLNYANIRGIVETLKPRVTVYSWGGDTFLKLFELLKIDHLYLLAKIEYEPLLALKISGPTLGAYRISSNGRLY